MARSWFNTAVTRAYANAGRQILEMSKHVQPAAQAAAEQHIAKPLRERVAGEAGYGPLAQHIKVSVADDGMHVGAKGPAADALNDLEIGTEDRPPTGHAFFTAMDNRKAANRGFFREMRERSK